MASSEGGKFWKLPFWRAASSGLIVFLHSGPYDKNKAESGEHHGEEETNLAPGAGASVQDPRLGSGSGRSRAASNHSAVRLGKSLAQYPT